MKQAIMAAEDERFYQHGGIDYVGVARPCWQWCRAIPNGGLHHHHAGGAQFLPVFRKTLTRKFNEALLAFKIEHNLSKDQILELYFNQIYLGQRAYGFAAAGQAYYGRPLKELSIAQMAMLAGLPKAPSSYNPVVNPDRARLRQLYVLRRMRELNFISEAQYEAAKNEPNSVSRQSEDFSVPAQYVAEMVRQTMFERYKENAYTDGYRVYTTVDSQHQKWAFDACAPA